MPIEADAGAWWKEAVVYQIYPRSFRDADGDGIGDLRGITEKLDYLAELGVDIVWLCPVCASPNVDNGYDVSDYRAIAPEFGTMEDFDRLVAEMRARGLKLMMDLVFNHSSDQHPWFRSARASKDSPYRDYYLWRDAPNDWRAVFGGSAWTRNEPTGDWYCHLFAPGQPDLNWENPALRRELYDVMRFWAGKGVAGFRLDVISFISKQPFDTPQAGVHFEFYANGPKVHLYLQEMRREVLAPLGVMSVGEAPGVSAQDAPLYVAAERGELDMIFHFDHAGLDRMPDDFWRPAPWRLSDLKDILIRWDRALAGRGWNSLYLGNHDLPRLLSRFGDTGAHRRAAATLFATMLLTLRGTPYIYQGDEIGMINTPFEAIGEFRDIVARNGWAAALAEGRAEHEFLAEHMQVSRDHARTPMQWDASRHGGFTSGTPWIRTNPDYAVTNVAAERADPGSVYHHYRRMIALRKATPALVHGDFVPVDAGNPDIFAYVRALDDVLLLVMLNVSAAAVDIGDLGRDGMMVTGNYDGHGRVLRPFEARVLRMAEEPGDYASPACSINEVDPAYMGLER
ncbi:alpha-glucosidase [Emcibacter sp. SYSU 3D8]|uniref:alpha-glucosidase n=1 Tax=Emcibacter sp. SYSU 3D8 TaxID=3133969 RepID=UPI0031FF0D8E